MSTILEAISAIERMGGKLTLEGERVKVTIPPGSQEAQGVLERLRKDREEVALILRDRTGPSLSAHIDPPRLEPCRACHSRLFWRSIHGRVICWRCHAPASDRLVADILWDGEVKWFQ